MRQPFILSIRRVCKCLVATSLYLLTVSAFAGPPLTPHIAEYKIEISIVNGKLTTQFETTETGYMAESVIKATGLSRLIAGGSIREQ